MLCGCSQIKCMLLNNVTPWPETSSGKGREGDAVVSRLIYLPEVGVIALFVYGRLQVTRRKAAGRNDGCLGIFLLYDYHDISPRLRCEPRNGGGSVRSNHY